MIKEKVEGHPNLIKKEKAYVVSIDQSAYEIALKRRKLEEEKRELERRVFELEQKVNRLIMMNTPFI